MRYSQLKRGLGGAVSAFLGAVPVGMALGACEADLGAAGGASGASRLDDGKSGEDAGVPGNPGEEGVVCVGEVCTKTTAVYHGPGEAPMRRLNHAEYGNTIADLFRSAVSTEEFPPDARTEGFDTLPSALAVSPIHIEAYMGASEQLVAELFDSDPAGLKAGWCNYQTGDAGTDEACATEILTQFSELAFRRPLNSWPQEDANAAYLELLDPAGTLAQFSLDTRLRTALSAVLLSPRFLYRVEFADAEGNLDQASLASRLSYFLWSSAPDGELLQADLSSDDSLEAQSARLQEDSRFDRFTRRFPDLWLGLEKLATLDRDPGVYPDYSAGLGEKMGAETRTFLAGIMNDPAAPVSKILGASVGPTDPDLQALYGDSPRQGLVTQAAILAVTGVSTRTAPVRRGLWVLEALLCEPPPPPPPDILAAFGDEEMDPNLTERERLEIHRAEPSCAGCHVAMDAIGLGLENYDSIGAFRDVYPNGNAIDPSGVLPGVDAPFDEPIELLGLLAEDDRFPSCVVRKLFTYGAGRAFEREDNALVSVVHDFAGGPEMTFRSALNAVVLSDGFRRREEEVEQ